MSPLSAWDFDKASLWRYRALALRVIDGDTLTVLADSGYYGRHEVHIRLAGFSAPELREVGGTAARRALADVLTTADAVPWPLRVISRQRETVVSEVRSFERYVADVLIVRDGVLVDVTTLLGTTTV